MMTVDPHGDVRADGAVRGRRQPARAPWSPRRCPWLLAAGIGQKIIRDEKKRQVAHRRQQAKIAARRYVEEVGFIMNKESRDALRRTQRLLRDDFQLRAMTLHRSSVSALGAARQAMQLSGADRAARVSQLRPRPASSPGRRARWRSSPSGSRPASGAPGRG